MPNPGQVFRELDLQILKTFIYDRKIMHVIHFEAIPICKSKNKNAYQPLQASVHIVGL